MFNTRSEMIWKDASVETPKHSNDVLVATASGCVIQAYYRTDAGIWIDPLAEGYSLNVPQVTSEVTHWMEMPHHPRDGYPQGYELCGDGMYPSGFDHDKCLSCGSGGVIHTVVDGDYYPNRFDCVACGIVATARYDGWECVKLFRRKPVTGGE